MLVLSGRPLPRAVCLNVKTKGPMRSRRSGEEQEDNLRKNVPNCRYRVTMYRSPAPSTLHHNGISDICMGDGCTSKTQ